MEAMLSGRAAAEVLAALTGTGTRQARQLLELGVAGPPLVERGTHLFQESRLRELVERPLLDPDAPSPRWTGLLVLRRAVPATLAWRDRADALEPGWTLSLPLLVSVDLARQRGPVLALGTTAGFVVTAATLTGIRRRAGDTGPRNHLTLGPVPPGLQWLESRRVVGAPGPAWSWHWPTRRLGRAG